MLSRLLNTLVVHNSQLKNNQTLKDAEAILRGLGKLSATAINSNHIPEGSYQILKLIVNAQTRNPPSALENNQDIDPQTNNSYQTELDVKDSLNEDAGNLFNSLSSLTSNLGSGFNFMEKKELTEFKVPDSIFSRSFLVGTTAMSILGSVGVDKLKNTIPGTSNHLYLLIKHLIVSFAFYL